MRVYEVSRFQHDDAVNQNIIGVSDKKTEYLDKKINGLKVIKGDCLNVLRKFPDDSIDLIMTSPPYADNRRNTVYEGVPVANYVDWFRPISQQLYRVLNPRGSFVLNVKERVFKGQRHTYVLELILEMTKQHGWLWVDEYIWHKKNSYPGKWKNRFRDSWERCLHFTKSREFNMYQTEVMVPVGPWAKKRLNNLSDVDRIRDPSKVGSGFAKKVSNWLEREKVFPDNVLFLDRHGSATEGDELLKQTQEAVNKLKGYQTGEAIAPGFHDDVQAVSEALTKLQLQVRNDGDGVMIPVNVLNLATESRNKGHSASYPLSLPRWFIKLFTSEEEDHVILDPFIGSGTTAIAAIGEGRKWVGIEKSTAYRKLAQHNIRERINNPSM